MSYLHNDVYDSGLSTLQANGSRLDICSTEPTTYAQATATYSLGNKSGITVSAPEAGNPTGRQVTISSISDGSVPSAVTAAYWAITDGSAKLLAAGSLSASQVVTHDNTFTLTSFTIRIPAPAA